MKSLFNPTSDLAKQYRDGKFGQQGAEMPSFDHIPTAQGRAAATRLWEAAFGSSTHEYWYDDPGYQQRVREGKKVLWRSFTASGLKPFVTLPAPIESLSTIKMNTGEEGVLAVVSGGDAYVIDKHGRVGKLDA